MTPNTQLTAEHALPLYRFIVARHKVYLERAKGRPAPWTSDQLLQRYRFCNVYRELDKVTVWVKRNYRTPYARHPDVWFSMVVARLLNKPETLGQVAPLPWKADHFKSVVQRIIDEGGTAFSAAYIVSTNGVSMPKAQYLADHVLTPLWQSRHLLRPLVGQTLDEYHQALMAYDGMGSFIAAQVVADLKNTPECPLYRAPDWHSWAAPGPGSTRGMSRVLGRGASRSGYKAGEWLRLVNRLQDLINPQLTVLGWPLLCAHDMQNCLCEFDKYERVRLGEGEPKQRYPGEQGVLI